MKKMMINWQNMKSELFVSRNGAKPKPKKLFLRIGYWKINLTWRHWSKALVIGLIWTWISSKKKSQMWLMKLCIFWKAENSFGNKLDWDKANIKIRFFSLSISHRIVRERENTTQLSFLSLHLWNKDRWEWCFIIWTVLSTIQRKNEKVLPLLNENVIKYIASATKKSKFYYFNFHVKIVIRDFNRSSLRSHPS